LQRDFKSERVHRCAAQFTSEQTMMRDLNFPHLLLNRKGCFIIIGFHRQNLRRAFNETRSWHAQKYRR
jgi:hypothetical protein